MKYGKSVEKAQVDYFEQYLNLPKDEKILGAFDCGYRQLLLITSVRLVLVKDFKLTTEITGSTIDDASDKFLGLTVTLNAAQDGRYKFRFMINVDEREAVIDLINSIKNAPAPTSSLINSDNKKSFGTQKEWKEFAKRAREARGKLLGDTYLTYNGGFGSEHRSGKSGFLYCFENEVLFKYGKARITVPANQITGFEVTGQKQTTTNSRLSVTRMVTLGVFSLAAPKRSTVTEREAYVSITLKDGHRLFFHSSSDAPDKVHSKLSNAISYYSSLQVAQKSKEPAGTQDIAGEIERFADLKERGILTEDEFQAKKKQLLGL